MTKQKAKLKMDANAANIPWPTDKWGITRELRKAVLSAGARLKGDKDKKALLDATLDMAVEWLENKYHSSIRERDKTLAREADKESADEQEPTKEPAPKLADKDQLKLFDLPE